MKKGLYNKFIVVILSLAMVLGITGCAPTLQLTEEESREIGEYAAGLLLKYDKNYSGSLVELSEEEEEELGVSVVNEPLPEPEPLPILPIDEGSSSGSEGQKNVPVYSDVPVGAALQVDGFDLSFVGFEVCKTYSGAEADELAFSFEADKGKDLLLAHFAATNLSQSEATLDLVNKDEKFRLKINEDKPINNLKTMLLNDLDQIYESFEPGETRDTVVVFQIPEGSAGNAVTVDMTIKFNGESFTYKLM